MQKAWVGLLGILILAIASRAEAAEAQGPFLGYFSLVPKPGLLAKTSGGETWRLPPAEKRIRALAEIGGGFDDRDLVPLGWKVSGRHLSFATLEGEEASFHLLSDVQGILAVEKERAVVPSMDAARRASRVDQVLAFGPNAVPGGVSGKGVLIGFIDMEYDIQHPAFLDSAGKTRFVAVWDWGLPGDGTSPTGTGQVRSGARLTEKPGFGLAPGEEHGTHVAGIAAGSERTRSYYGVAPRARLVGMSRAGGTAVFADGIRWMFRIADSLKLPCVINISMGGQTQPMDGTSVFDRFIDSVTGPGRIVVIAAANEGQKAIHAGFDPSTAFQGTWVRPRAFPEFANRLMHRSVIQYWGEPGKPLQLSLRIVDTVTGAHMASSNAVSTSASTWGDDSVRWTEPATGKRHVLFYRYVTQEAAPGMGQPNAWLELRAADPRFRMAGLVASEGKVHAFAIYNTALESRGVAGYRTGDNSYTLNGIATARSAIVAGSYVTKVQVGNYKGGTTSASGSESALAESSGRGPTLDGRVKPDICAPGSWIVSAFSSGSWLGGTQLDGEDHVIVWPDRNSHRGLYMAMGGTSMAAPFVSGVTALLLEVNPRLSPQDIRGLLQSTAIRDGFTGAVPNNDWGHGKVDAQAAVAKARATVAAGKALPDSRVPARTTAAWTGDGLQVDGLPDAETAIGSIHDWSGRRISTLRPLGKGRFASDIMPGPGVYLAVFEAAGETHSLRIARD